MVAFGSQNNGGKRHYMAEINVTPLVDVMLVLLIIFMVTAPMMTKGLDIKLPNTTAKPLPQKQKPVVVTLKSDGQLYLNKIAVDPSVLRNRLSKLKSGGGADQVLLRADREVPYGTVAGVIAAIREAGVEDLGLVTQPADGKIKKGQKKRLNKSGK